MNKTLSNTYQKIRYKDVKVTLLNGEERTLKKKEA